ncbi:MAG: hypothetical protein HYY04_06420 [Chloroflexi bacterium]|nr:hypothetical protein [Chloroflexota bacterium]
MMMTSREIVQRAIEFRDPERIALIFPQLGFSDTFGVRYQTAAGWQPSCEFEDEWGCVWEKTEIPNMGQPTTPVIKDWGDLATYRFPDPHAPGRFDHAEAQLAQAGDKYVVGGCGFTLLERAKYLRGFAELLEDLYLAPEKTHYLLDRILEFQLGIVDGYRQFNRAGDRMFHGIMMSDDWGTQLGPMISLPLFREFFKPRYERLFAAIHEIGCHAWLHSCGRINAYLPDFLSIGLDVINPQQPNVLGIEEAGREFAGRICFDTTADIQTTMPRGDADEIRAEARRIWEHWGGPHGGLIIRDYSDYPGIGAAPASRLVLFRAFWELGAGGDLPEVVA